MATLTTPTPTHQVLFNAKSAAGSELTSNRTVLELYGNEMPTTVYFIIQHWQKGREIEVDRILPTRNVLPLCNVHLSPVTAEKIEADTGKIKPSRGCVSMAELMSTGMHRGSFKVHLDETLSQPVFGKFVQNSSFDDVFTQSGNITKDNRFILTVREIITL